MTRPLIGITAYSEPEVHWGVWTLPAALIPTMYVEAIDAAGGRALLVPPSEQGVEETLDALDGLLFSGGSDLDPDVYGAEPHPETNGIRPWRDAGELAHARVQAGTVDAFSRLAIAFSVNTFSTRPTVDRPLTVADVI